MGVTVLNSDALWQWIKENPPETIEEHVLQHVKIRTRGGKLDRRGVRKSVIHEILDGDDNVLLILKMDQEKSPPATVITRELLKRVICGRCGHRLLVGEDAVCGT